MKGFRFLVAFLLPALFFLVSCKTSYVVPLEIQKPSTFTIPGKVDGLLVVNNAVPQPGDQIISLKINRKDIDMKQVIETDTNLWTAALITSEIISDANFYDKTSFYKEALRDSLDNEWLAIKPLTQEKCDSLYEESGCNVIIPINRLVFNMQYALVNDAHNNIWGGDETFLYVKCKGLLSSSVYFKSKANSLTSFNIQDSLIINTAALNDSVHIFHTIPDIVVKELTKKLATTLASYFIPEWEMTERTLYTSSNARMREADKYFKKNKWDNAREIWESLFYKSLLDKEKAHLAMNIGTAYELGDNLILALDWVRKATNFYKNVEKSEKERDVAEKYMEILNLRIFNNKILDIQYE